MTANKYLSNLTPLRGIAALLTVIFHVNIMISFFDGTLLDLKQSPLIWRLYLMVDFFFVLSGFILCYVYAQRFTSSVTGSNFKKFTIARFARVYPLHLFSLLLTALFLFLLHRWGAEVGAPADIENSPYSFVTNLLLLHSMNLHEWFTFTHASWSISVEWWMYMIFPFLIAPFMKLNRIGRIVIFALCVVGYLWIGYYLIHLVTIRPEISFIAPKEPIPFSLNVSYQYGFFRCLFGFVMGMMIYFGYKEDWGKKFFSSGYIFSLLVIGMLLCMHFEVLDVITVLFFPFILLSAAYGNPGLNAFLSTRPLQRLGDWSFSIYLMHQPFLYQGTTLFSNPKKTGWPVPKLTIGSSWLVCIVFIIFILFVSYLTYRFIEIPARNFINKKWGHQKAHVASSTQLTA